MAPRKTTDFGTNWHDFYAPVKGSRNVPRPTVLGYGPAFMGGREVVIPSGGPEAFVHANPGLFATSSTSREEGFFYWGCLKEIGPAGQGWKYQSQVRNQGARAGQATVDFIIEAIPRDLACRIVTPRFHLAAGPEQEVADQEQLDLLEEEGYEVVDVFSQMYMNDESGGAVRRVVRMVIAKEPLLVPGSASYFEG